MTEQTCTFGTQNSNYDIKRLLNIALDDELAKVNKQSSGWENVFDKDGMFLGNYNIKISADVKISYEKADVPEGKMVTAVFSDGIFL